MNIPAPQPEPDDPGRSFSDYRREPDTRDRYCKGCEYNLRGKSVGTCPECGLPFSLTNPRTYLTSDQLGQKLPEGLSPRLIKAGAAFAMCWFLPAFMITLFKMVGGIGEGAMLACCGYLIFWPVIMIAGTVLVMNAMFTDRIAGVLANIGAASLIAGILFFGQWAAIFLVTFGDEWPSPILLIFGLAVGPVAGLWRAHQQT